MPRLSIESYEEMLNRLYSTVKVRVVKGERFEPPTVRSFIVGSRTVIANFKEICEKLNRPPEEMARFFLREMATGGGVEDQRLILVGRFEERQLNSALQFYIRRYVFCPVCKSPDTELVREKKLLYLKCLACGAISPVPDYR